SFRSYGYAKNFSRTVRTKAVGQRITFYLIPIPKKCTKCKDGSSGLG
ncbi:MAG: hypothetical protein ACI81P_003706, partial [Neolewinella sp.]